MREIKFQFVIDGKFLSKPYTIEDLLKIDDEKVLEDMEKCDCHLTESMPSCEGDCVKYENSTITGTRRFTGLNVKGVDVYEGDIVISVEDNGIGTIVFRDDVCAFVFDDNGKGWDSIEVVKEVIGNIYSNPELLNH